MDIVSPESPCVSPFSILPGGVTDLRTHHEHQGDFLNFIFHLNLTAAALFFPVAAP